MPSAALWVARLPALEGVAVLHRMLQQADVVLVNSPPGVAEQLGVDAESVHAINPRIVHCSITGFGRSRPHA